jgi:hypothetical protein
MWWLFSCLFCLFIDFADRKEAGVGEDVWAYDNGTDSETSGYVLGCWRGVFASSTSGFPDFGEMEALHP